MKFVLIVLFCLLFSFGITGQTKPPDEKTQEVTNLILAKEDAEGEIVEGIEELNPKDIPLYCYIDLSSERPTMVMMKVVAVKAKRIRKNSTVVTVKYKTKQGENGVEFNAKPGKIWAVGDYRVDVYLDGKLAKSKEFKVLENTKLK